MIESEITITTFINMSIAVIVGAVLNILLLRLIGAWMFRITDVIDELKKIRKLLERESVSSQDDKSSQLDAVNSPSKFHSDSKEEIIKTKEGGLGTIGTIVVLLLILFVIVIAFISLPGLL